MCCVYGVYFLLCCLCCYVVGYVNCMYTHRFSGTNEVLYGKIKFFELNRIELKMTAFSIQFGSITHINNLMSYTVSGGRVPAE